MIISAIVLVASVFAGVIESPSYRYLLCAQAQHGGSSELFVATMVDKLDTSSDYLAKSKLVILKCHKDGPDEAFVRESQKLNDLKGSGVVPVPWESFKPILGPQKPCIAMEKVGINLESLRMAKPGYWPPVTLGSIGVSLLGALRVLHNEYHVVHRDLHAGNVCLADETASLSSKLFIIDLGDMIPLQSDDRASANFYQMDEVRQAVLTIRYLLDGDTKYYVTKRYVYDPHTICQGNVPSSLCDALRYIFELLEGEAVVDYDFLITKMRELAAGQYTDGIVWNPYIEQYGMPDLESLSGFRPIVALPPSPSSSPLPQTSTSSVVCVNSSAEPRSGCDMMSTSLPPHRQSNFDQTVNTSSKEKTRIPTLSSLLLTAFVLIVNI